MTCNATCDVAVIGGGPGGLDAALACAERGMSVVLAEARDLGGVCLNRGCIPTKLMLAATAPLAEIAAQARYNIYASATDPAAALGFDHAALMARKDRLIAGLRQAAAKRLKDAGVRVVHGRARFTGPESLAIATDQGEENVSFGHAVLATGSRPAYPKGLEPDGKNVLSSTQLLGLDQVPESLLVLGGGAVGLELAAYFRRLGCRVDIVEAQDRLAPNEDPEVSEVIAKTLKREKYGLHLGSPATELAREPGGVRLKLATGLELQAAKALVALGRVPNSRDMGLEELGVELAGPGWPATDEHLRVTPRILAVGDVNGRWLLAHAASHQALHAAKVMAGETRAAYDPGPMPSCIYGPVEAMRAGASAAQLKAQGCEVMVSKAQLAANPMAQAHGASQGMVKAIWVDGRVRSVVAAGTGTAALASLAASVVAGQWDRSTAESFVFPHPGLEESLGQALLAPVQAA